jgi:hypothetical protein
MNEQIPFKTSHNVKSLHVAAPLVILRSCLENEGGFESRSIAVGDIALLSQL